MWNIFVISGIRPLPSVPVTIKTDVWYLCLSGASLKACPCSAHSHLKNTLRASHENYKSFFKGMYSSANYNEFTGAVLFCVT